MYLNGPTLFPPSSTGVDTVLNMQVKGGVDEPHDTIARCALHQPRDRGTVKRYVRMTSRSGYLRGVSGRRRDPGSVNAELRRCAGWFLSSSTEAPLGRVHS
jgi:hypothetical protein